jgi:monoterpene epsilon-lactone hydrolase
MPSLIARVVKRVSRVVVKREPRTRDDLVRHLRRAFSIQTIPPLLARGTRVEQAKGSVRGEWIRVASPERVLLYIHGGGYIGGVTSTYHNLCSRLAVAASADVFLARYRFAPEHPFPAAHDDVVAAYTSLLDAGHRPEQIVVAGDSAGGGLTLGLLLALRDRGIALPRAAIVLSPLADLTFTSPSIDACDATDAMLSTHLLRLGADVYVRSEADRDNPYASPAFGEYTGLPPLFIAVCETECLRDDAYAVAAKAREAGVSVTFLARPDLLHVWPIFAPVMPEARADLQKMVAFIREHA